MVSVSFEGVNKKNREEERKWVWHACPDPLKLGQVCLIILLILLLSKKP
jgi:hypothetical protein